MVLSKKKIKEYNLNWQQIPDHWYRILIIVGLESAKTNSSFNLISHQSDTDQICLYAKDHYEAKYKFLINKWKKTCSKLFSDSKAFLEYSNDMDNIYKNIKRYSPNKKSKMLIIFDNMIVDKLNNKKKPQQLLNYL